MGRKKFPIINIPSRTGRNGDSFPVFLPGFNPYGIWIALVVAEAGFRVALGADIKCDRSQGFTQSEALTRFKDRMPGASPYGFFAHEARYFIAVLPDLPGGCVKLLFNAVSFFCNS